MCSLTIIDFCENYFPDVGILSFTGLNLLKDLKLKDPGSQKPFGDLNSTSLHVLWARLI